VGSQLIEPVGDRNGLAGFVFDHRVENEIGLSLLGSFRLDASDLVFVEAVNCTPAYMTPKWFPFPSSGTVAAAYPRRASTALMPILCAGGMVDSMAPFIMSTRLTLDDTTSAGARLSGRRLWV
jgi:hypothetical protein